MDQLYFTGLIIAVSTFLIIGLFHPIVIKGRILFLVHVFGGYSLYQVCCSS